MNKLTYFTAKALTLLNRLYTLDDYFYPIYIYFITLCTMDVHVLVIFTTLDDYFHPM